MAKKRIAHKIEFHVDHDEDATFTQIASIRRIGDAGKSRDAVDLTCLADDIDMMEPAPTLTLGDCTLTLFWDEADTTGMMLLEDIIDTLPTGTSAPSVPMKIVFPFSDGTITKTFNGWVKELGEASYEVKGEVTRDVTIHLTSIPVNS